MSRVSYVMLNAGSEKELTRAVRGCLAKLTAELCRDAGIERTDVLEVTIVGNPVMHHLLLGIDPTELGGAPFALAFDAGLRLHAGELGLPVNPGARAYVLPCIAGHVGADTAGVILAEAPHLADEVNLIVDVGTNAEIVLGNRERLLAASSPTGPAFEGAQISCGQRAAPGAIERVRIDRDDARAAHQGRRLRRLVGRAGVSRRARHRRLRLGDRGGRRRALPRGRADARRHDRRRARGADAARRAGRADVLVRPLGRAGAPDHPERHPADPAGQGGAPRRLPPPDGALRHRARSTGCGSPERSARTSTRCTPSSSGSSRTASRTAVTSAGNAAGTGARIALARPGRAGGDRARRPGGREGRDGGRAAIPGALRARDGDPARHRPVRAPGGERPAPRRARQSLRRGPPAARRVRPRGGRHDRDPWQAERRAGGTPGGAAARARRARAVPDPDARPGRGALRRGALAPRGERRPDPRGGGHRVPRRAPTPSSSSRERARPSTASGCGSRAACAARSSRRRRRRSSPRSPGTARTTSSSVGTGRSSRRPTAPRSSATSTADGGTGRSRTSATS